MNSLVRVCAVEPSPCGRWLCIETARVRPCGTTLQHQLWRLELDGARHARLLFDDAWSARSACFHPDGTLGFLSDRPLGEGADGPRVEQVWSCNEHGGALRVLTRCVAAVSSFRFAHGTGRLFFMAMPVEPTEPSSPARVFTSLPVRGERGVRSMVGPHLYVQQGSTSEPVAPARDLTPGACAEYVGTQWDVSADGERVVLTRSSLSRDLHVDSALELRSARDGRLLHAWQADGLTHQRPLFDPRGERIAVVCHAREAGRAGRPELRLYGSGTGETPLGEVQQLECANVGWPSLEAWCSDGRGLFVTSNERGAVPVLRIALHAPSAARMLTDPAVGGSHQHVRPVPGCERIVGLRHGFLHPPEPFACEVGERARPRLLTTLSGFDEARGRELARCEAFEVEAGDGALVHGFVLAPRQPRPDAPALLWIHGGPIACTADAWSWRFNPLLATARGYAVILPNPRGSIGYGQDFVEGVWNNAWGDACYRDVATVLSAARTKLALALAPSARIAAIGGSFGGYMANLLACRGLDVACVVSHAGPFHLSALYGESDIPGWRRWEMGVDPNDDPQAYDRHSPHLRVRDWRAPALFSHGVLDGRVPFAQSLRAFEALQRRGIESSLILYPDEGHRIEVPRNLAHWYDHVFAFLARHLQPEQAP